MNIKERIYRYKNYGVVQHAKYNPVGQGMVRIHLVPSRSSYINKSDIIILNNKYVVPIAPAWSILLSSFMKHINKLRGMPVDMDELQIYINMAVEEVSKIYITVPKITLKEDLSTILDVLFDIAKGNDTENSIGQHTLLEYASNLRGPIRAYYIMNSSDENSKYCYNYVEDSFDKLERASFNDWKKIIKKCKKACVPYIVFVDEIGEDLSEIIDECNWFVTTLNSNGNNLTKEYCKKLYDVSLDKIVIKLYSSNEIINNKLSGKSNFNKVIEGIKNSIDAGLNVTVSIPVSEENTSVISTVKYVQALGVTDFNISIDSRSKELKKDEVLKVLNELTKYAEEESLQINFKTPNYIEDSKLEKIHIDPPVCGAGIYEMTILPNGDVTPCLNLKSEKFRVGNMLIDNFESIWNSIRINKMRKIILSNTFECPAKRYLEKK